MCLGFWVFGVLCFASFGFLCFASFGFFKAKLWLC